MAWVANAKFIHGVAGVILDKRGRVLLLKHRFWKQQLWGLPGGHARHNETPGATLRRELREETGLEVRATKLLRVTTNMGPLTQFILLAECDGEPEVKSAEIIEAGFFDWEKLPENIVPTHRAFLEQMMKKREWTGLDPE